MGITGYKTALSGGNTYAGAAGTNLWDDCVAKTDQPMNRSRLATQDYPKSGAEIQAICVL